MITLSNIDGDTLQISITGYQYPDPDGYFWDLNWLSVNVRWQRGTETWQASDPCLSTEELLDLQIWLNGIQSGSTEHLNIEFMEPCLRFAWRQDSHSPMLRIYLSNELDPRRSEKLPALIQKTNVPNHDDAEQHGLWLEFPVSDVNMQNLMQALATMTAQFPVRHERPFTQNQTC